MFILKLRISTTLLVSKLTLQHFCNFDVEKHIFFAFRSAISHLKKKKKKIEQKKFALIYCFVILNF